MNSHVLHLEHFLQNTQFQKEMGFIVQITQYNRTYIL
jgi:hypothetical protein